MLVPSRRALGRAAGIAASLALTAAGAAAQVAGVNPFSFGVSAGAVIPTGDLGDIAKTGYSVDGVVNVRVPTSPVSFRGEVGYTRLDAKDELLDPGESGHLRFISGVANVVYSFSAGPTAVVRPYLIAGAGVYNLRVTGGDDTGSESVSLGNKLGINGGVGLEIPLSGITGFAEVRVTRVSTDGTGADDLGFNSTFVPIRFGIRF